MRNIRIATISALGAAALLAPAGSAFASTMTTQTSTTPAASASALKTNAANERTVQKLIRNTNYTPIVQSYTPKPTSTKGFNGYETIIVKSPQGTSPVAGYFKLSDAQQSSAVVTSAKVDLRQNAYVVKLTFPGEQGNPGHLTVNTISR